MDYYQKYIKYKNKYHNLASLQEGNGIITGNYKYKYSSGNGVKTFIHSIKINNDDYYLTINVSNNDTNLQASATKKINNNIIISINMLGDINTNFSLDNIFDYLIQQIKNINDMSNKFTQQPNVPIPQKQNVPNSNLINIFKNTKIGMGNIGLDYLLEFLLSNNPIHLIPKDGNAVYGKIADPWEAAEIQFGGNLFFVKMPTLYIPEDVIKKLRIEFPNNNILKNNIIRLANNDIFNYLKTNPKEIHEIMRYIAFGIK